MKIKLFCLFVSLLLVSGVSAQVADTVAQAKKQVVAQKPKTQAEMLADKVMKLKITPQNLADVKEVALPTLQKAGIPTDAKDVVAFVDGKEVPLDTYKNINPANINSITILKNQEAIKTLTTKKCTSVIVITTKKKATAK
jgi:hypothetical protein